jgi:hypothetical protein
MVPAARISRAPFGAEAASWDCDSGERPSEALAGVRPQERDIPARAKQIRGIRMDRLVSIESPALASEGGRKLLRYI